VDTTLANQIAGVLGVLMLLGTGLFLFLYVSRANWRGSPLGRHMLYFMVALALVLVIRIVGSFWPGMEWLAYARVLTYALLVLVIWQRVFLLIRALRKEGS
jgi:hypothetical protein